MATIENLAEDKKGPSLVMFLVTCAVITLVAGGAGFGVSATFLKPATMTSESSPGQNAGAAEPAPAAGHGTTNTHGAAREHGAETPAKPPHKIAVVDIPPITTNLFDPSDAWIRMELSLVFEESADQEMAESIHQDILAYVHTMKLYNLRGGSGYQHLVEDLQERAAIRSEGRVKRVLVRSFILE
jgi:flagellar FliL protein